MLRRLSAGTSFVRARPHDPATVLTSACDLGSPPPGAAGANRMSPAGVSMFYGADDAELAAMEVRPLRGQAVTSARWALTRDAWCLDLTQAEPIPSVFDMTARIARPWLRFLAEFAADLSKLVAAPEVDYLPTQIVTAYVRDELRSTTTGDPIDAIIYASSIDPSKRCWVVFAEPHQCADPAQATDRHLLVLDPTSIEWTVH